MKITVKTLNRIKDENLVTEIMSTLDLLQLCQTQSETNVDDSISDACEKVVCAIKNRMIDIVKDEPVTNGYKGVCVSGKNNNIAVLWHGSGILSIRPCCYISDDIPTIIRCSYSIMTEPFPYEIDTDEKIEAKDSAEVQTKLLRDLELRAESTLVEIRKNAWDSVTLHVYDLIAAYVKEHYPNITDLARNAFHTNIRRHTSNEMQKIVPDLRKILEYNKTLFRDMSTMYIRFDQLKSDLTDYIANNMLNGNMAYWIGYDADTSNIDTARRTTVLAITYQRPMQDKTDTDTLDPTPIIKEIEPVLKLYHEMVSVMVNINGWYIDTPLSYLHEHIRNLVYKHYRFAKLFVRKSIASDNYNIVVPDKNITNALMDYILTSNGEPEGTSHGTEREKCINTAIAAQMHPIDIKPIDDSALYDTKDKDKQRNALSKLVENVRHAFEKYFKYTKSAHFSAKPKNLLEYDEAVALFKDDISKQIDKYADTIFMTPNSQIAKARISDLRSKFDGIERNYQLIKETLLSSNDERFIQLLHKKSCISKAELNKRLAELEDANDTTVDYGNVVDIPTLVAAIDIIVSHKP